MLEFTKGPETAGLEILRNLQSCRAERIFAGDMSKALAN